MGSQVLQTIMDMVIMDTMAHKAMANAHLKVPVEVDVVEEEDTMKLSKLLLVKEQNLEKANLNTAQATIIQPIIGKEL